MDRPKSSAPAPAPKASQERLTEFEERYRRELADDETRQEWRDQILRLRRRPKSARELARTTSVGLIDVDELAGWLEDARERE